MKTGILRIFIINFICFLITFCSFFYSFSEDKIEALKYKEENVILDIEAEKEDIILKEENKEKEEEKETEGESEKSESKSENSNISKPVSAEAIKGNIISKYISPYNASLSYDKVYIKNNTDLKISIKDYLNGNINFSIKKNNEPQVLILHTHATETFMTEDKDYYTEDFSSRTRDNTKNMVALGKIVAEKLNKAGIKTLHDTTLHDYPSYSSSYSRAAQTITKYLKKYPSIKVVLDLHRDAVSSGKDKVKLVTEIEGKKAAQVMLVMGSQSGSITNFPKWEENFKLALRLQKTFEEQYPTLARPLLLMSKNYNESLTTGSLLIEFGTDANTLEEAKYSAQLVGNCLARLLDNI